MSISKMSRCLICVMHFFIILVKYHNPRPELSSLEELPKLLKILIQEFSHLPELFLYFHEVLTLRESVNVLEWVENLVYPVEHLYLVMA